MAKDKYCIQKSPFIVPVKDGKLIEEFFGNASVKAAGISFAHMIAPPGWSEPFQTPGFDEITYIIRGKKHFEIDGNNIVLEKNESIIVYRGTRVRYSNPFDSECEYVSVCIPAFSFEKVNRESE